MSLLLAPIYAQGAPAAGALAFTGDSVVGTTYAMWTIGFDGFTYHQTTSGRAAQDAAWISPQVGMSLYECRATAQDTTPPPGTYDTWLDCGNSHTWGWANSIRERDGIFLLEIRRKSDLVVVASGDVECFVSGTL